jgi:hypothetical protein
MAPYLLSILPEVNEKILIHFLKLVSLFLKKISWPLIFFLKEWDLPLNVS